MIAQFSDGYDNHHHHHHHHYYHHEHHHHHYHHHHARARSHLLLWRKNIIGIIPLTFNGRYSAFVTCEKEREKKSALEIMYHTTTTCTCAHFVCEHIYTYTTYKHAHIDWPDKDNIYIMRKDYWL